MSTDINFKSLIFKHDTVDFPFLAIATILSTKFSSIKYQTKKNGNELMILPLNVTLSGELTITRFLARTFNTVGLYGANFIESAQVDEWLDKIEHVKNSKQFDNFFIELNKHLTLRTFLVGHQITLADIALFYLIFKDNKVVDFKVNTHVKRWFDFVSLQEVIKEALTKIPKEVVKEEGHINIGSMGSYEKIVLENAVMGQVKVRFPPEPSGFLHMGHFKAVLLNSYYKNHYKGNFILRFDDTNPSNEKEEYVEAIMEDLKALGVEWDGEMTRTSQYFDLILEKAVELIKNGDAFVDDTPQEKMSEQRREQIDSVHRNNSIEKNLEMWQEMIKGSEFGLKCVLRAKIDMKHKIAALRDPSLARCMDVPHPVTGDKFKCYPLYDLACPIVDSIEGVTHALRDSQYCDRKDFYTWVIDKLKLRKVYLKEFSRINFEYTLLSKRKLDFLIKQGAVEGWDSPAVPTVRGILNRGMTPKALKMFIESQGASLNMTNMSMDKLWAINKKLIDPEIPRFFAVKKPTLLTIDNFDVFSKENIVSKVSTRVKNFPKEVIYTKKIFMEQKDARSLKEGEEVVFMDFGVVSITKIEKNGKVITSLSGTFLPNGDFKDKNKKKVTWLADIPHLKLNLVEYDHLITTKKLAKDLEDWKTVIRPKIKYETSAIGDPLLKTLKKRDKIQLERLGNFICNQPWTETTPLVLVNIPDGHQGAPSVLESKLQKLKRLESQNNKDSKDTKN